VQVALELSREHEVIQGAPEPGVDLRGLHRDGHPRAGRLSGASSTRHAVTATTQQRPYSSFACARETLGRSSTSGCCPPPDATRKA
jgi:hypothetical protein